MESDGQKQEIEILQKTLQKEKTKNQRLTNQLESSQNSQKKAESELQIRRQASLGNNTQEQLIAQKALAEELRKEKSEMANEIRELNERLKNMHDSKIRLVQNVAQELDRMRGMFVEISVQSAKANTVG